MAEDHAFHTRTVLAEGLRELFRQLEERLSLSRPLNAYLAGGMAVHLYTATRVTTDVDAEFGGRVFLPNDLTVEVTLEDGTPQVVYLDTNYNSTFALMHEDYQDDSIPVELGAEQIRVYVLSPVDLAVSKIARFADNDKEDIAALVRLGLTTADEIEQRATSALEGYIGGQAMLKLNLRDAVVLARQVESERVAALQLAESQRLGESREAMLHWISATAGGAVEPVGPGTRHEGPVLHADEQHCIQRTGKRYAIHRLADLDTLPVLGNSSITIQYRDGKATVKKGPDQGIEH